MLFLFLYFTKGYGNYKKELPYGMDEGRNKTFNKPL